MEKCDDLRFFLRHVGRGGLLHRVEEDLVVYTLSEGLSSMTHRKELVKCRGRGFWNQILDGIGKQKNPRLGRGPRRALLFERARVAGAGVDRRGPVRCG